MEKYKQIINKYPNDKGYLIEILRDIQSEEGYISDCAIQTISKELYILDVDIEGVISFYSMLTHKPTGKYCIRVCKTACCKIAGKDNIVDALKKEVKVSELKQVSEDGLFSIEQTECIGQCDIAPAMMINDKPYGNLTSEKIKDIIKEYRNAN